MASPSPWIAYTLIDALDVYLALEFEKKEPEEIGVVLCKYIRSIDHLTIFVEKEPNKTVRLLNWQVSPTGKLVEALVTDGKIEIKTLFLRTALHVAQHSHSRTSELHVGSVLRLHDFDFCLVDSLEPPRVTLYLRRFDVLPRADIIQTGNLSTIDDHEQARNYLSLWKDFEKSRRMGPYPESPQDIQSQVGDDEQDRDLGSDIEDQDSTSVSQAQFATQIPLQESRKQRPQNEYTRYSKVTESYGEIERAKQIEQQEALQTSVNKSTVDEIILRANRNGISPSPELTQMQIVAPSATTRVGEIDPEKTKHYETSDQSQNSVSNGLPRIPTLASEKIPDSIAQMLIRLRKECQDDRYVPRRLQSIPKDQAKLLSLDDRWQPPLVGRIQRPGTVPLNLLNRLTEKADQANELTLFPQSEPLLVTTGASNGIRNDVRTSNDAPDDSDDDHSSSPEDIEWPSSPLRAPLNQRLLPPDSPSRSSVTRDKDVINSQQGNTCDVPHGTEKSSVTYLDLKTIVTRDSHIHDISRRNSTSAVVSSLLPPSTLRSTVAPAHAIPPRTVQVKRTPFQTKEVPSIDEIPDSSAIMVPGTFDEHAIKRSKESTQDSRAASRLSDRVIADGNHDEFEMDTSEDEIAAKNGRSEACHPPAIVSKSRGVGTRPRSKDESFEDRQPTQTLNVSAKRKIKDSISRPTKRMKSSERVAMSVTATTSEYDDIDQDRARQRREFLGRIGKRRDLTEPALLPNSPTLAETKGVSSPVSHLADTDDWASSPLPRAQVDTPDTHSSTLPGPNNLLQSKVLDPPRPTTLKGDADASSELYRKFKSTYLTYGGEKKHFDAACQILKRLFLQDKATHQSLWDDFVFRHFHDYRSYLLDVMENCGSALPYEKFYQEHVEQPTCLRRLIRPAYINGMTLDSASASRFSLESSSFTVPDETHLRTTPKTTAATARSIAVESSVSNIVATEFSNGTPSQREPEHTTLQTGELEDKRGILLRKQSSQESRSSVKIWLERAAGAESPILGTTAAGTSRKEDIPVLELADEALSTSNTKSTSTQQQKKRRSLPWQNARDVVSPQSVLDSGKIRSMPNNDKFRTQQRRSLPSTTRSSIIAQPQPSRSMLGATEAHQISTKTSNENQTTAPDTAFTRFTTFYKALPGESKALKQRDADALKLVNIFSWRR